MSTAVRLFCLALLGLAGVASHAAQVSKSLVYTGMCDASAGVAISSNLFVAADDELNVLRVYPIDKPGSAVATLRLDAFLEVQSNSPEADIEGAARVGDVIYWISSHGRNKSGKERTNRERFFATRILPNAPYLQPIGRPYKLLEDDFIADPALKSFKLEHASMLAPKEKGALNIEGMAATADGTLWIGFRNPIVKKKALLIPLLNPKELIEGGNARAKLGKPELLDLGGKGIRDMAYNGTGFYVIAGSYHGGGASEIYQWNGPSHAPEKLYKWAAHVANPEAVFLLPGREGQLMVLSDEGAKIKSGVPCKELPEASRQFRGLQITLD